MRRFFSMFLAICILFAGTVYADFPDMPNSEPAKTAILNAVSNKILSGYEDGTVRPDSPITRAEMASIITRVCGATQTMDISKFGDVSPDDWFYSAISSAYYMGAFSGDGNGQMRPKDNISFQEAFTVLSQVFDLLPPYTVVSSEVDIDSLSENEIYAAPNSRHAKPRIYDVSVLSSRGDTAGTADWAKPFVAGVIAQGGCEGITIAPTENITRAEFAIVMNNIIKNYIDEPGTYTELPAGNTVIRCDNVLLDNVSTDSDIYIADGVGQGKIGINNISPRRLIIRGCAAPLDASGKPQNDNFGLSVSGKFYAVRIIRPYIVVDMINAEVDQNRIYCVPHSVPNLFNFGSVN
ncbi:MAG: S-layer homology domain-containing protein [Clostridia bacterium]|nr:S-layer homology domain-containing protein [Clostridia bacterium]